ncbi:MAG: tRNA pseudouridine(55) synthase TruB [Thermodesulfovibrionales bacterium]|nr:tRNA pseudouridine(55) synthase TruB [Thermodesulfovibrionales bacterium]
MNIIINLNKSAGITSHDAVISVKKLFKVRKAGHAGTLDPIATGILLICLNEATKVTKYLSDLDKEYIMTAKLGESTDTYDSEGEAIKRFEISDLRFQIEDIEKIIQRFVGEIEQIPPMFSAIKVSGKPLYKLARKGIEVERKPRRVTIHSIEILRFENPFLKLKVSCSKGTYIRSLCNDIGNALGVGAHITELIRTKVGSFALEKAAAISELPHKISALHPIDSALEHLPEIILQGDSLKRAQHGNPIKMALTTPSHFVRLKSPDDKLFGIGRLSRGFLRIERLLLI